MKNDLSFFYFSDIKKLFFEKRYYLFFIFIFFFLLTFIFLLTLQPKYEAKASFYEDVEKTQTIGNLKDIVLSDTYSRTTDAFSFLKTKVLVKKLIEKLALQITVVEEVNGLKKICRTILKNLKLYFHEKINTDEEIKFSQAFYEKNFSSEYYIKILSSGFVEILDEDKKLIIKTNTHFPVQIKDFCFTINKIPQAFLNKTIKIRVDPWSNIANKILKDIEITKEKTSSNFLFLKTKHVNRFYSAKILNTLMDLYHNYLKEENENLMKNQLVYLEKRKKQLEKDLYLLFDENEKNISMNVKSRGFVDLNTEIANLLRKRENYQKSLVEVTNELDFLKKINFADIDKNICLDEKILNLIDEIKRFENKKQALQISIDKDLSSKKDAFISGKSIQIDKLISERNHMDDLIEQIDKNNGLKLKSNSKLSFLKEKTNIINNKIEILKSKKLEFNNKKLNLLDLKSANDLFIQLEKTKDDFSLEIFQLKHILEKINTKEFQISSISAFLSSELIKNISEISRKIEDDQNYTSKELATLKQAYNLEKKYIISHLQQLLDLKKMNIAIINQKLFSLKKIQINLIAHEVEFLTKKVKDLVSKNIYEKINEKNSLEKNLEKTKVDMQNLVAKIGLEKKMNMKAEMIKSMIDSITKLIESKKLDLNLKKVNSKPVDLATVPDSYKPVHFFRNSFIVAITVCFIFFIICIYITVLKGFPISVEAIKSLSFDYCGVISFKCNGIEVKKLRSDDLESLRKIITSIDRAKNKIITFLCSKGPNYIHYLAALLAVIGKKILVIETKSEAEEKSGLFPFLEKDSKRLPIQKIQAYDFLPSGKKKYFAFELLRSEKFFEKLQQIKSKYDLILIYSDAKIDSAEARVYLEFSDKIILTFKKETFDDIQLILDWAKEKNKLSFVTY